MRRSASLLSFCFAGAILNGAHCLAHLKLKVLEQRGQLGFQFPGAVAQLNIAFAGQLCPLLIERVLLLARGLALLFQLGQLVVHLVEKAAMSACCEPRRCARSGDDVGIQSQPLCGLDAGRRAGDAEA